MPQYAPGVIAKQAVLRHNSRFSTIHGFQRGVEPLRLAAVSAGKRARRWFPNRSKRSNRITRINYVVADASRPELARFRDYVGQVRTVNMNGRALVEFIDYHLNIGWFDIDLDYLKVVDKPAPKEKAAAKRNRPRRNKPRRSRLPQRVRKNFRRWRWLACKARPVRAMQRKQGRRSQRKKPLPPTSQPKLIAGRCRSRRCSPRRVPKSRAARRHLRKKRRPPEPEPADVIAKVDRASMSVAEMIALCREKDAS